MFVKFMYQLTKDGPSGSDFANITSVYECEKYSISSSRDQNGCHPIVSLEHLGVSREIAAENTEVFIMNNEGKTIDRFEF